MGKSENFVENEWETTRGESRGNIKKRPINLRVRSLNQNETASQQVHGYRQQHSYPSDRPQELYQKYPKDSAEIREFERNERQCENHENSGLYVGQRVVISGQEEGIVRYLGPTHFQVRK